MQVAVCPETEQVHPAEPEALVKFPNVPVTVSVTTMLPGVRLNPGPLLATVRVNAARPGEPGTASGPFFVIFVINFCRQRLFYVR